MEETQTKKKSVFESPLLSTKIKSSGVKLFPEAGLGYLLGPLLALISNGVINTWLIQYWDKVLMLGSWNSLFETLLPIISAIVVVIGNLFVGRLMERKPTFAGKARPFILLGLPFIAVALLVLFIVPLPAGAGGSFSNLGASIIIAVGYNLYYAVAWPIYYTSHSALVNLSTRDGGARGLLSTCIMAAQLGAAGLAGMAGGLLVDLIGLLPVYQYTDAEGKLAETNILKVAQDAGNYETIISPEKANSKWTILMIIMIVCLVIGCLLEYYFTRERITEENVRKLETADPNAETSKAKSVTMSEQIKICVKDKYWWLIMIFFFLYQFGGQMKNNDMSFYSQAYTGGSTLSSLINTVGAIPTALGMLIVWPLANKFTKSKTIVGGCALAFLGSLISLLCLLPNMSAGAISGISVASFIVKALGTAPAMYIALALLANVLDHQEALYGKRTDGFTMAVYGSIMVAMAGVCNGIIVGFNNAFNGSAETLKVVNTILGFLTEGTCYLIMGIMFLFMNVEKYTALDNEAIVADQKAACLASGQEWIEPKERARREDEENARLVEEGRITQLKADCEKKGLNFEEEEAKYQAQKAEKDKVAAEKKAAAAEKKAEKEKALIEKYNALPEEVRQEKEAKAKAYDESLKAEYQALRDATASYRAA